MTGAWPLTTVLKNKLIQHNMDIEKVIKVIMAVIAVILICVVLFSYIIVD